MVKTYSLVFGVNMTLIIMSFVVLTGAPGSNPDIAFLLLTITFGWIIATSLVMAILSLVSKEGFWVFVRNILPALVAFFNILTLTVFPWGPDAAFWICLISLIVFAITSMATPIIIGGSNILRRKES